MKHRTHELKKHAELCAIVPEMAPAEWDVFLADVKDRGVIEPVRILPDGTIIDGHNRVRAAREAGIEELDVIVMDITEEEVIKFGVSAALMRRNLNEAQRLELATDLECALVEVSLKERAAAGGKAKAAKARGEGPEAPSPRAKKPRALAQAAAAVGESPRKVRVYKKMKAEAPDLAAAVKSGEKKFSKARAEFRERTLTISGNPDETLSMVAIELPTQPENGEYTVEFLGILHRRFPGFAVGWRIAEGVAAGAFLLEELEGAQDFHTQRKASTDSALAKLADALSGGATPPLNLSLYVGKRYRATVIVGSDKHKVTDIQRLSDASIAA